MEPKPELQLPPVGLGAPIRAVSAGVCIASGGILLAGREVAIAMDCVVDVGVAVCGTDVASSFGSGVMVGEIGIGVLVGGIGVAVSVRCGTGVADGSVGAMVGCGGDTVRVLAGGTIVPMPDVCGIDVAGTSVGVGIDFSAGVDVAFSSASRMLTEREIAPTPKFDTTSITPL